MTVTATDPVLLWAAFTWIFSVGWALALLAGWCLCERQSAPAEPDDPAGGVNGYAA